MLDLAAIPRDEFEALSWQVLELARPLANRLREDSRTSSRPPSGDNSYQKNAPAEPAAAAQNATTIIIIIIEDGAGPSEDTIETTGKSVQSRPASSHL